MRVGLMFVLAVATGSTAWAEKVKTNQDTKVLNHPGEQGKVVVKVKSGQNMTVLAKEGRWIKVRVSGRTGYVPRSKVDMADDDEIVRNTRRRPFVDGRGPRRGFGTDAGPDDRVGADATGNGDDDDTKKPAPPSKDSGDDDDKPAKKPAVKKPAAPSKDSDDDDDKPAKKPTGKKPAAASPSKDSDDDDKPAKKPTGKKPAAQSKDSDDEDDKPVKKPGKAGKDSDDDDVKVEDDDEKADDKTDDKAEDAPAEKRITAHVGSKTKIFSERDEDSEVAFVAKPADMLYPADSKGKWTMVETDEGDAGWTLTSGLEVEDDDGGGGSSGPRAREIGLSARAGLMFLQQGLRATGGMAATPPTGFNPDNYDIGTSAATISLGGAVTWPYKKKYILGVEATLDYASTVFGGIHVTVGTVTADTGISIADYNLRGIAGYDLHKKNGMVLYGRLGLRYRNFAVSGYNDPMKNPALLPQETVAAPSLGVALAIPRLTPKAGLFLSLDTILFGASVSQTAGLEDGKSPSMSDFNFGGRFVYHWKKDMDLLGTYNLDYGSYDFGAPNAQSTRGHSAMDTDTTRTDISHTLTFGISKAI